MALADRVKCGIVKSWASVANCTELVRMLLPLCGGIFEIV